MYPLALTSIITLGVSVTGSGLLSQLSQSIRKIKSLNILDQCMRGIMLSYAIYYIGSELLETFNILTLLILTLSFFAMQYAARHLIENNPIARQTQSRFPWLIYTLIIPHFISEGFAIIPQVNKNPISIIIAGFLLHKTIEVAMLTASTHQTIHCKIQRFLLQTLFVTLTPLSILLFSLCQGNVVISRELMRYTEFLNFIVFIQLAMFCGFCEHNDKKNHWIQANKALIASFGVMSVAVYFIPELFGTCSC